VDDAMHATRAAVKRHRTGGGSPVRAPSSSSASDREDTRNRLEIVRKALLLAGAPDPINARGGRSSSRKSSRRIVL